MARPPTRTGASAGHAAPAPAPRRAAPRAGTRPAPQAGPQAGPRSGPHAASERARSAGRDASPESALDSALDRALDTLRARGHRVTSARRAVIQALLGAEHGLSAGDVAAAIGTSQPDTHLSTVYRTLEALEEAGIVAHVHAAHGGVAYQLADRPHQVAVCDMCGAAIELPVDILDGVAAQLAQAHDFELHIGHFPLLGRCASCRRSAGSTPHRHGRS